MVTLPFLKEPHLYVERQTNTVLLNTNIGVKVTAGPGGPLPCRCPLGCRPQAPDPGCASGRALSRRHFRPRLAGDAARGRRLAGPCARVGGVLPISPLPPGPVDWALAAGGQRARHLPGAHVRPVWQLQRPPAGRHPPALGAAGPLRGRLRQQLEGEWGPPRGQQARSSGCPQPSPLPRHNSPPARLPSPPSRPPAGSLPPRYPSGVPIMTPECPGVRAATPN